MLIYEFASTQSGDFHIISAHKWPLYNESRVSFLYYFFKDVPGQHAPHSCRQVDPVVISLDIPPEERADEIDPVRKRHTGQLERASAKMNLGSPNEALRKQLAACKFHMKTFWYSV